MRELRELVKWQCEYLGNLRWLEAPRWKLAQEVWELCLLCQGLEWLEAEQAD